VRLFTGLGIMPHDPGGWWNLADGGVWDTVLKAVKNYSAHWSVPPGCQRLNYYGMILPAPGYAWGGLGFIPGNQAIGQMDPVLWWLQTQGGGQIMAHELGHNYGRPHVNCTGTEEGAAYYPYPEKNPCRIADPTPPRDYYGFFMPITSTVPMVITPTMAGDLMSYSGRAWISDFTYRALISSFGGGSSTGPAAVAAQALPTVDGLAGEYLYASGEITPTDGTAALDAFYRTSDPNTALLQGSLEGTLDASAPYSLTLKNGNGDTLMAYPFQPGQAMGYGGAYTATVSFGIFVPMHPDTARISLHKDGVVLASRTVSSFAPVVNIASPAGGESISSALAISWQASDLDSDALTYVVKYSADDGTTWQPLVTGWAGTTLTVSDLSSLPGSSQARVQVLASDGVNTGQATSERFTMGRHAPLAHITEPATGSAYHWPQPVVLRGAAWDAEDGTIVNPSQLRWTSDISGALGAGPELWINTLPVGTHRITLTVADSDQMTATDQIVLTVGNRVYLPLVFKGQ
jgi:hypothetical protein